MRNDERITVVGDGHLVGAGGRRCSLSQAAVVVSSQLPPATGRTAASASSIEGLGSQANPLISTNNRAVGQCRRGKSRTNPGRDTAGEGVVLGREGTALGGRGDVGAVDGDDGIEEVAGLGDVMCFDDHPDRVVLPAASHRDAQVAASRRAGGEFEAGRPRIGCPSRSPRRQAGHAFQLVYHLRRLRAPLPIHARYVG